MLIQVDVDSTLYDSDQLFNKVAAAEFGIEWPTSYASWFKAEDIGTDLDTLLKIFERSHSEAYALDNVPYPNAAAVLRRIAEQFPDVEIAYVSDRNEQLGEVLREWLQQEDFLHDENQHVAATNDKRVWMREVRPDIVIDDRVRTLLMSVYELGSVGITLQHDHNANLKGEVENLYVVPTWLDIEEVLKVVIPKIQSEVLV